MNTEIDTWKPAVDYEGFYEVSHLGKVRAVFWGNHQQYQPGRILKPHTTHNGYLRVELNAPGQKPHKRPVHHLVLEAFSGPQPEGKEALHLDGFRWNNRWRNLKWGTHKENMSDERRHGTCPIGVKNPAAVLNEAQVLKIRELRRSGQTYHAIARTIGINWVTVWDAANRKTWRHVP